MSDTQDFTTCAFSVAIASADNENYQVYYLLLLWWQYLDFFFQMQSNMVDLKSNDQLTLQFKLFS